MSYSWKYFKISRWYDSSFLSQYSLKMRPFKNHTWNSPNQFEGLQTEALLIKEWFLKLISNLVLDHSSIILHFYFVLASFTNTHPLKSAILMSKTQKTSENCEQSNKTPKNSSQELMGADSLFYLVTLGQRMYFIFQRFPKC